MSQSVMLSFRVPEEILGQVQARADELGMKRSVLLRAYIEQALGNPALDAQIREAVHSLRPIIARVMAEVSADAIAGASAELEERLQKELISALGD